MSNLTSARTNLNQNREDFNIGPLENQAPIFKYKLFERTLDPIKGDPSDPNNIRTCTVKCLYRGCP